MTRFWVLGAVLVLSTVQLTPVVAQVSEPAAAADEDPNFSIYSDSKPSYSAMAQTPPQDVVGSRRPLRRHHSRHVTRRY